MITDSRTQNRLYADTDTVLFSLENRKEATDRMMEILKDTPECLQMMNHVPSHAMEDGNAGWWDSEYAGSVISSLMETLDSYTPEGYRFGPQSGTMNLYGYWKSGIGKDVLCHVHYTLQTGYEWGKGLPHEKAEAFYREISGLFRKTDSPSGKKEAMFRQPTSSGERQGCMYIPWQSADIAKHCTFRKSHGCLQKTGTPSDSYGTASWKKSTPLPKRRKWNTTATYTGNKYWMTSGTPSDAGKREKRRFYR